jgi:hypothetical protein
MRISKDGTNVENEEVVVKNRYNLIRTKIINFG